MKINLLWLNKNYTSCHIVVCYLTFSSPFLLKPRLVSQSHWKLLLRSLYVALWSIRCIIVISKQHTEAFDFIVISLKSASLIQVINGLIQQFFVEKHCHGRKRAKSGCTCTGSREKIEFFKDILRRSLWVSNHRFKSRYFYKQNNRVNEYILSKSEYSNLYIIEDSLSKMRPWNVMDALPICSRWQKSGFKLATLL